MMSLQTKNSIGELIVPRKCQKLEVQNGKTVKKVFFVEGRKIPLKEIRERTFQEHNPYMKIKNDDYYKSLSDTEVKKIS